MVANIIHMSDKPKRLEILMKELKEQEITDYRLWEGIHAKTVEKGINLAHKQIVRYAKENELDKVLIFEDDIQFTDRGAFKYFIDHEPLDYDLYLGGIFLGTIRDNVVKSFTAPTCYMVHKEFYEKYLATDNDSHIDHALSGIGKYIVCEPFICRQHNGISGNTGKYENYDFIFETRKMFKQ